MNFGANLDDSNARLHRFPDFGPRDGSLGELIAWKILLDCPHCFLNESSWNFLEIVELSHMVYAKIQNGIFHSNGHNFASRKDFLASPEVLESRSSRLHDAQKISSIRPLGAKCELVRFWIDSKSYNDFEPTFLETARSELSNSKKFVKNNARSTKL